MERSMDAVDNASFHLPQAMYWPSVSRGQASDTIDNPGKLLDAQRQQGCNRSQDSS